ncbi:acyl carrier protein [Dactylosporangium sp. NPDC051485]|uniref:acyl carrier protein n=1 Tax=Dactylosporangium sp. NPDC051485 TaxID=3154846 RepID=UPI00341E3E84
MPQLDSADVMATIRDHLLQTGHWADPPADLAPDYPLLDSGVLDSLGLMRLVAHIEERFPIRIDDVDILPENFEDLASIVRLVHEKALVE